MACISPELKPSSEGHFMIDENDIVLKEAEDLDYYKSYRVILANKIKIHLCSLIFY